MQLLTNNSTMNIHGAGEHNGGRDGDEDEAGGGG